MISLYLGLSAAACGSVSPASPDASPDTSPVTLVATSPADGDVSIDVTTHISLTFSGDLPAPGVHVFERSSRREVPVSETSWDPALHQLTLTLVRPLAFATEYRVVADDVPAFRFRTYINQPTGVRSYDMVGNTSSVEAIMHDANGFIDHRVVYDANNAVVSQQDWDYRADGELVRRVISDATGQVTSWSANDLGDAGPVMTRTYNSPGADGIWLNQDDGLSSTTVTTYDDHDRLSTSVFRSATGAIASRSVVSYDESSTTTTTFDGPGADGTWETADDTVGGVGVHTLGVDGQPVEDRVQDRTGNVTTYYTYAYDSLTGQQVRRVVYQTPGPDGIWGTADDQPTMYYDLGYGDAHRRSTEMAHDRGPDGIAYSADDMLRSRTYFNSDL